MTREERQLLLKDLCARLPYYTELYSNVADHNWAILTPVVISNLMNATDELIIKPYLRPMSSMTEEETDEYDRLVMCNASWVVDDWLHKNHFDYRRLIPMGLALEAPEGMYKNK